ncbi:peptidoglycan-binding domain-containing protein [Pelagibius sp. CAU 1746]|uniref:peptidoglycan-binding domain-containing protein n=1 Tax=Pelagibius sp. CAU 1746 TaxID=3140370 RepID=UPI00325B1835
MEMRKRGHSGFVATALFISLLSALPAGAASGLAGNSEARPAWADPRHPEIDYRTAVFLSGHQSGDSMSGWWMVGEEKSRLDDSLTTIAKNVSQFDMNRRNGQMLLLARCHEGRTALAFVGADIRIGHVDDYGLFLDHRIDEQRADRKRWTPLSSGRGAILFSNRAVNFMRHIKHAEKLYLRIKTKRAGIYDADFSMAGAERAFQAVAVACGWDLWNYAVEDYKEIQLLLKSAGFDPGETEGRWSEGSEKALAEFQASVGLPASGLPDYETIKTLGFH